MHTNIFPQGCDLTTWLHCHSSFSLSASVIWNYYSKHEAALIGEKEFFACLIYFVLPPGWFPGRKNCALTYVHLNPGQVLSSCGVKTTANNHSKDDEGTESLAGISKLVTGVARCAWSALRCFFACLEEFSPWLMLETYC